MNRFDDDLKAAIKAGTQKAAEKKNDIWNNIEKQLKEGNMSRKKSHAGKIIAAVIAAGLVITGFTPLGQAAINSIAQLFEPQRAIDVVIEGDTEQTDQQLHVGTAEPDMQDDGVTYVLYVDEERYEFVSSETGDRIVPKGYPSDLPEVYMQIVQDTKLTPQDAAAKIKAELGTSYIEVRDIEQITAPIDALRLVAINGYEWNDDIVVCYFIDNSQGGTFIITAKYFVEAEEGHGARFEQMLADFEIVSVKQAQ